MSNIRVELQLEDGSFVSGVRRAGQTLEQFKKELARTDPHFRQLAASGHTSFLSIKRTDEQTRSLGQSVRGLTIGLAAAGVAFSALSGASSGTVGNLVRINAEMEKLRYQMAGMSDAADPMKDAADQVKYLQTLATSTPFALGALSDSFVKMRAAGLDPANGSLKALSDGLASFGASDEQLKRVTVALTQMQGKGVLSMEELRQQLGESMPNAMRLFARSMGVSVGDLTKLVSSGTVESKAAIQKFLLEVQLAYTGTGEMMMQTFNGQMARLRTALVKQVTSGEIKNAFDRLKEIIGKTADYLGTMEASKTFDALGRGLHMAMNFGEGLAKVLGSIKDLILFFEPVLPVIFGGAIMMAGATRMMSAVQGIKMRYLELKTAAQATNAALLNLQRGAAVGATSALGQITTASEAALAASMLAQQKNATAAGAALAGSVAATGNKVLGPLLTVGRSFLGLLGPIGLGLAVLGPTVWEIGKGIFSWFKGAKDTNDELETMAQGKLRQLLATQGAERQAIRDQMDFLLAEETKHVERTGQNNAWRLRELERLQNAMTALEEKHADARAELSETVIGEQVQAAVSRINTASREMTSQYNRDMIESEQEYQRAEAAAVANGSSVRAEQEARRLRDTERRKALMDEMIGLYTAEINLLEQSADKTNDNLAIAAGLLERRKQLEDQRNALSPEQLTVELLMSPEDDKKKEERLQRFFNSARDKVEDLSAELNGASGAVAKLAFQIRRGDFGRLENGTAEAEKMRDALLATTIAAEALDEVMKGLNAAKDDIDRIADNLVEGNLKMQAQLDGVNTDDALAMWRWKRAEGQIEGLAETAEETVRSAMEKVTQGVDLTFSSLTSLSDQIRQNTFGDASVARIDAVADALGRVRVQTDAITGAMGLLDFANIGMPGTGLPNIQTNVDGGLLDLIASVESGGDYNATLDNGRWTNGPQNLTAMTLREVQALQAMMRTPENRALYGNGQGSSALGRYQIVGNTLTGLMREMGLTGNELFNEEMQDAMAQRLVARRGRNVQGLRNEWEGLNRVDGNAILTAYDRSTAGPTRLAATIANTNGQPAAPAATGPSVVQQAMDLVGAPVVDAITAGVQNMLDQIDSSEAVAIAADQQRVALEGQVYLKEMADRIAKSQAASTDENGEDSKFGTLGRQVRADRASGDYNQISDADWERMIAAADLEDQRQKSIQQRIKDQKEHGDNERKLAEQLIEIDQRRADALAMAKDPNHRAQSSELTNLLKLEREQLDLVGKIYGVDSEQYRLEAARLAQARTTLSNAEAAEALVELTRAAEESEKNAAKPREQRQIEFKERMDELASLRDQAIRDGALVADAQKAYDRAVAAERKRLRDDEKTALQATLDQMGKLSENVNAKAGEWAQSLSDTIYDWASGGDGGWVSVRDKIREDIAKAMIDKGTSIFLKPFEQMIGGDGSEGSGIGGILDGLLKKAFSFTSGGETDGALGAGLGEGLGNMLKSTMTGVSKFLSSMFSKSGFFPVKHTGGIVGQGGGWGRSAPASIFAGAPKFHTGGIIGKPNLRKGLSPSEVPIIAQKGEGVFTPEQMAHLGGTMNSQAVNINAPITVNASGGTPEQNADLAKQMARESEQMFRGIVQQELVQQMRQGNMLSGVRR